MAETPNDSNSSTAKNSRRSKYRHVKAFHSEPRASYLSHDSESTPSFLGFRNLMVLVLSMSSWPLRSEVERNANSERLSNNEFTISCREFYEGMLHGLRKMMNTLTG